MKKCPSEKLMNRYIADDCEFNERQQIETHLKKCEDCRNKVASARQNANKQREAVTKTIEEVSDFTHDIADDFGPEPEFENYRIVDSLPKGGQAFVYKAIHIPTQTIVAVKVLQRLASEKARHNFKREVKLIARLNHPNIVKIRDSGIIYGKYFFVMEYITGQPLDSYLSIYNLSFRERVILFNKICTAIIYAHNHGVVHRDLKFSNIIVDKYGEPHILDFGLAKAVNLDGQAIEDSMPTITGQWAGSLATMSPEQAAGQPHLIDVRTDVYSLGIILYHILIGMYPYKVDDPPQKVLETIQKVEPTRPRQIIRKFDSDVEAILLAALAKDLSERYQSVAEMKRDLENWLHNRPISARPITTIYLLRKVISKHRYASAVLGLLLLIILSFSYISFDFYITAMKSQRQTKSISRQWSEQEGKTFSLAQQMTFTRFLEAYHEDRNESAKRIVAFLPKGSKEQKGAIFLLDPESSETDFIKEFSKKEVWFAYYIVAEKHFKNGQQQKSLTAYRHSFEASQQLLQEEQSDFDKFINSQIKARLYELTVINREKNDTSAI